MVIIMINIIDELEAELENMTPQEIEKEIGKLKKEIRRWQKSFDFWGPFPEDQIYPYPDAMVMIYQEALDLAIAAYEKNGGIYHRSKSEQKAEKFNANIPKITRILFAIGRLDKYAFRTVTFVGDHVKLQMKPRSRKPFAYNNHLEYETTKEVFLERFRMLHMGKWEQHYNNPKISDGPQWDITIEYEDGQIAEYDGNSAYPFSFALFCALVGYNDFYDLFLTEEDAKMEYDDE